MKKINVLFVALIAMMATFTSCEETETVSDVVIGLPADFTVATDSIYTVAYTVKATESKIATIEIRKGDVHFEDATAVDKSENAKSFEDSSKEATTIKYTIIVTDKDDLETVKTITVTIEEPVAPTTDLAEATSFEWARVGSTDATGLDMFGLAWTSNSGAGKAVIKKDATKLVVLTAAEWTSITTVEALKTAVDAADDVATFEGVTTDQGKTYDEVIATVNDDVYYMIHITSSTVETGDAGTTIKIMGDSKK